MSLHGTSQDKLNAGVYHSAGVEGVYRDRTLTRVETMALLKYQREFSQKDILDIGVGTGRTTEFLAPLARRYEGIDYSPVMVQYMHTTQPGISVHLADMRNIAEFPDDSFDFVFAPNNVIDAVGHVDRLRTLVELRRVIRPCGMLAFSTHNRHFVRALENPHLHLARDPLRMVHEVSVWVRQMLNHAQVKTLREVHNDYALLNDEGHDYALLHYYVTQNEQRHQLAEHNFDLEDVFGIDGRALDATNSAPESPSLMYMARRRQ